MKINEAPQDKEDFKGKSSLRKVLYVTQKDGSYTTINSDGWEVENMATRQAWEAVSEDLAQMEQKVKDGVLSPVAYYMHKCLMELPILAKYMKKWEWQVKRHFKPEVFQKLNEKTLQQYAKVFNVSVQELKHFDAGKKDGPRSVK